MSPTVDTKNINKNHIDEKMSIDDATDGKDVMDVMDVMDADDVMDEMDADDVMDVMDVMDVKEATTTTTNLKLPIFASTSMLNNDLFELDAFERQFKEDVNFSKILKRTLQYMHHYRDNRSKTQLFQYCRKCLVALLENNVFEYIDMHNSSTKIFDKKSAEQYYYNIIHYIDIVISIFKRNPQNKNTNRSTIRRLLTLTNFKKAILKNLYSIEKVDSA